MDDTMIKAFFTLGAAVAFIAVILMIVKKLVIKKNLASGGIELKVLSRINLQPKTAVYIIKADEKTLLIGVTDHNVNLISDLTEDPSFGGKFNPEESTKIKKELAADMRKEEQEKFKMEQNLSFGAFLKSAFSKTN